MPDSSIVFKADLTESSLLSLQHFCYFVTICCCYSVTSVSLFLLFHFAALLFH